VWPQSNQGGAQVTDAPTDASQLALEPPAVNALRESVTHPSRRTRALLALAAGVLSGIRALLWSVGEGKARDIDQVWYAAHALFSGRDPYAEIGPGLAFDCVETSPPNRATSWSEVSCRKARKPMVDAPKSRSSPIAT
jgi:hypothetical protein